MLVQRLTALPAPGRLARAARAAGVLGPRPRRIIVTGCGRSGTTYMSMLLSRAGIPCGHEDWYGPHSRSRPPAGAPFPDSSWLAAPYLADHPSRGDMVVHLVRHPLHTIASLAGIPMFTGLGSAAQARAEHAGRAAEIAAAVGVTAGELCRVRPALLRPFVRPRDFATYVALHDPELFAATDEISRDALHWLTWNRIAQRAADRAGAGLRVQVESMTGAALRELIATAGYDVSPADCRIAVQITPRTANRRGDVRPLTLADIPDPAIAAAVRAQGRCYGYDLS